MGDGGKSAADRSRAVARRVLHLAVSASVLYWWFPERVEEVGLTRDQLVLAGVAILLLLEAVRLSRRRIVFPMREYERRQMGGHAWLVLGCAVAVVFFDQRLAMLTILGTTLVDPFIGELRGHGYARIAPFVGMAVWVGQALVWVFLVPLDTPLFLIPLGAAVAVAAESLDIPHIDDNFMMNMAPLLAMAAAIELIG